MKLLVINGPNLNLLGIREPEIYGRQDFSALENFIRASRSRIRGGGGAVPVQPRGGHCGQDPGRTYGRMDGIVINPAAYTHTSVAILDALKAVALPAVEVHLSNVNAREPFRQISLSRHGL